MNWPRTMGGRRGGFGNKVSETDHPGGAGGGRVWLDTVNKHHLADWNTWMPGTKPGEVVATHLNPVLYRA